MEPKSKSKKSIFMVIKECKVRGVRKVQGYVFPITVTHGHIDSIETQFARIGFRVWETGQGAQTHPLVIPRRRFKYLMSPEGFSNVVDSNHPFVESQDESARCNRVLVAPGGSRDRVRCGH